VTFVTARRALYASLALLARVSLTHATRGGAVARKSRKTVRIELTEVQKKLIREQTGEEVETIDFTAEEVEPRVTPRTGGTGGVTGTFF
jgi:hypothetical protein